LARCINVKPKSFQPLTTCHGRHGDTRHIFDVGDADAVARAQERFRELTGKGFRAVALRNDGEPGRLLRQFDREAEQTLFIPQLQGG
jgi:hypothetical protein